MLRLFILINNYKEYHIVIFFIMPLNLYNEANLLLHSLKSNWQWIKTISCQLIMLIMSCFVIFWIIFAISYVLIMVIAPGNSRYSNFPNLHVQNTESSSLMTIFINQQIKYKICAQESISSNLQAAIHSLGISKGQFCNFHHENLPEIKGNVNIRLKGLDSRVNNYVSVCIQYGLQQLQPFACQKYLVTSDILILKNVRLQGVSFFSLLIYTSEKMQLKVIHPQVYFQQQINFLLDFIKSFYSILNVAISLGAATFVTALVLISGIAKFWYQHQENQKYFSKTK